MTDIDIWPTITEIEVRFITTDCVYVNLKTKRAFAIAMCVSIELAKKLGLISKETQI